MLNGKKILLGICGSIAAYKSAYLTRSLIEKGAEVKVVMTSSATTFITPLTLSTLSKNPVLVDFIHENDDSWNNHVELGLWADVILMAPATANTIAKMAGGICDNLLLAVYLSARCPILIAPAMDVDMWNHPATQKNIATLNKNGNTIIDVAKGELASGLIGEGRMAEFDDILSAIEKMVKKNSSQKLNRLAGKKALVTAGPTSESIDPVRFISNHSSGKMGIALAETLAQNGTEVILVRGPSPLNGDHPLIRQVNVTSAEEMYDACMKEMKKTDIFILAAAVADYTPQTTSKNKLKKENGNLEITLSRTKDIAKEIGQAISGGQKLIGFALETDNEIENAKKKLTSKNMDLIVMNSLNDKGAGFNHDTNKITIIDKSLSTFTFERKMKNEVAYDIIAKVESLLDE